MGTVDAGIRVCLRLSLRLVTNRRHCERLGAVTTYGHASFYLAPHWQLMGTLEALNGVILFGLTTAFLFNMIREVWPTAET